MPDARDTAEEVEIRSADDLYSWLSRHHGRAGGVWLVHHRKASPHYVPMRDLTAACLAWGWIDSLPRARDALRTMHWIAPRVPGSAWSAVNRDLVAVLEAAGRMAPPGRAAVDAAKADGSWTALDAVERLEVPPDLSAAFDAHPGSRPAWDGFPPSVRRGILEWIGAAKRPATRAARIDRTASEATEGRRANQWRDRSPPGPPR